jgi:hypothetical protein
MAFNSACEAETDGAGPAICGMLSAPRQLVNADAPAAD